MSSDSALGFVMLFAMVAAVFIGFPISFTLLFLALTFGFAAFGDRVFDLAYLQILGLMKEEVLTSVPLFILMGYLSDRSGMLDRLFSATRMLLAPLPGALYAVVIITATVFAMCTGIVGAAVTVLGITAAPLMIRSGYDARLSAGAIAAGGTLGILIPPSVMLVVMGPVLGVSVADLYAGAILPGALLALCYLTYTVTRSFMNPQLGPPLPVEERFSSWSVLARELGLGFLPLLIIIGATMGSILSGLSTPSEAAAIGCIATGCWGLLQRKLSLRSALHACNETMVTTSMVIFLAVGANVFGSVFSRLGSASWFNSLLMSLPLPPTALLVLILLVIFLLGWPFEWPAIVLVFLPMFQPAFESLQLDPIWVGVLVAVTLQTAFLSPPVAMSAYYLKHVVPQWDLKTIYRGMSEFMVIQCAVVGIVLLFPSIATWLPATLFPRQAVVQEDRRDSSESERSSDLLDGFSLED